MESEESLVRPSKFRRYHSTPKGNRPYSLAMGKDDTRRSLSAQLPSRTATRRFGADLRVSTDCNTTELPVVPVSAASTRQNMRSHLSHSDELDSPYFHENFVPVQRYSRFGHESNPADAEATSTGIESPRGFTGRLIKLYDSMKDQIKSAGESALAQEKLLDIVQDLKHVSKLFDSKLVDLPTDSPAFWSGKYLRDTSKALAQNLEILSLYSDPTIEGTKDISVSERIDNEKEMLMNSYFSLATLIGMTFREWPSESDSLMGLKDASTKLCEVVGLRLCLPERLREIESTRDELKVLIQDYRGLRQRLRS